VPANSLVLDALIAELDAMRYTPAGIPALDLKLVHESETQQAGQTRQIKVTVKAVAFGALAERLIKQPLGSAWRFSGFLGNARHGKSIVLHIQEFSQD
jgi:primosomal replication protein N